MRYQITTDEALMGGWNHVLVDTTKAPEHRLYERGVAYSRSSEPPHSLLTLQRQLNQLGTQGVKRYVSA